MIALSLKESNCSLDFEAAFQTIRRCFNSNSSGMFCQTPRDRAKLFVIQSTGSTLWTARYSVLIRSCRVGGEIMTRNISSGPVAWFTWEARPHGEGNPLLLAWFETPRLMNLPAGIDSCRALGFSTRRRRILLKGAGLLSWRLRYRSEYPLPCSSRMWEVRRSVIKPCVTSQNRQHGATSREWEYPITH